MNKRIAEALVESGYADDINQDHTAHAHPRGLNGDDVGWEFRPIEPFADTLEGRRQADALEDWLYTRHEDLWERSHLIVKLPFSAFQWRLDRIKWCFEELSK